MLGVTHAHACFVVLLSSFLSRSGRLLFPLLAPLVLPVPSPSCPFPLVLIDVLTFDQLFFCFLLLHVLVSDQLLLCYGFTSLWFMLDFCVVCVLVVAVSLSLFLSSLSLSFSPLPQHGNWSGI